MSTGIVNAIGVGSAGPTLISFLSGSAPSYHERGASVRIQGLPYLDNGSDSLGDSINHVYAFTVPNTYSGQSGGCHIGPGGTCDLVVDQSVGSRLAAYIGISNNDDATCIAWISVQQFDNTYGGTWTSDVGYSCGQHWYESNELAGHYKDEDGGSQCIPECTWLDAEHTNHIPSAALKFDVGAYGGRVEETISNVCASTIHGPDNGPLDGRPIKRSTLERPLWMNEALVVSNHSSKSAEGLGASAISWGPDFVDRDSRFCDMESKTLSPICLLLDVEGCVEVEEGEGTVVKRKEIAERATKVVQKSYKSISKWGFRVTKLPSSIR